MSNWLEDATKEYEETVAGKSDAPQAEEPIERLSDDYELEEGEPSEPSVEEQDEASQAEGEDSDVVSADNEQDTQDIEEIFISDANGRRKIKVDYSDRNRIKKAYQMAAGMRKFQAERDRYKARAEKLEPEYKDLKESWSALESAFESDGIKGVVNLLSGKETAYDEWEESLYQTRRAKEDASPQELEQIELREKLARQEREAKRLARMMEERDQMTAKQREQADRIQLESQIHPAFEKYRFAGKLGDQELEQSIDEAIWAKTINALQQYDDDVDLTPRLIDQEFRRVARTFHRAINKESDKKATKAIESKKKSAKEAIQKKAVGNMKSSGAVDEFNDALSQGNLTSALSSWLSGKVKAK